MITPAMRFALLCLACAPATGAVLDLAGFVEQAERHDPGIAAARADMVVGQEGRLRARAGFFPRVEASWSRNRTHQQYEGVAAPIKSTSDQRQIVLTQPLFDWTVWSEYRQSEAMEARKQLQLLQAGQALRIKAVERYFAALAARDEAALNADTHASLQRQLVSARARQKVGEATLIDLRDIDAELARSANAMANARTVEQIRMRALHDMAGQAVTGIAGLPQVLSIPEVYPADVDSWAAQAASSHPEVQLRELDRKIAALATDRVRADFLPKASLQASYTQSGATTSGFAGYPPSTGNSISVQVRIPLFSGFDTVHGVRQGLARQELAAHEVEVARRQALDQVAESFAQAQSQRRSIGDLESYVKAAQAALDATGIGYRIGNRRESDLLQKQHMLLNARRDLLRARYEALVQSLRLKALTATLGVEDIRAVNAWLEGG